MKRILLATVLVFTAWCAVTARSNAPAAARMTTSSERLEVLAHFDGPVPELGGIRASATISAWTAEADASTARLFHDFQWFDPVTGEVTFSCQASVKLLPGELVVDRRLQAASLSATIADFEPAPPRKDGGCFGVTLTVNLTWTPDAKPERSRTRVRSGECDFAQRTRTVHANVEGITFVPATGETIAMRSDDASISSTKSRLRCPHADRGKFDFSRELFGPPPTLNIFVERVDAEAGVAVINGVEWSGSSRPLTFDWGDGTPPYQEWFPEEHVYADPARNYVVRVTSHGPDGPLDAREAVIRFVAPWQDLRTVDLPAETAVTIPRDNTLFTSRCCYRAPADATYLDDSFFAWGPRTTVEYVLSAAAAVQMDLVNNNVHLNDGAFHQFVVSRPRFGGMHTLWWTVPVGIAVGNGIWTSQTPIPFSSLFHEMGHNFTLNFPAEFHFGGKIDGNANAIYSETMAQIFQHATAYELINNARAYRLPDDLVHELELSALSSMRIVRTAYDAYVNAGTPFSSWNDPRTPHDETFGTFMTIAYQFFVHAEQAGDGYRLPVQRMMAFLQHFNEAQWRAYAPGVDSPAASAFRATLMVAALSSAFSADLRDEFRDLGFPVSDDIYNELMSSPPVGK